MLEAAKEGDVALARQCIEVMKIPLNTISIFMKTPLHLSIKYGKSQMIRYLLSVGADIDASEDDDIAALHIASQKGDAKIIELLLSYGANTTIKNKLERLPIFYAMQLRNFEIAVMLWKKSFRDMNEPDYMGRSAAWYLQGGHCSGCKKVLENFDFENTWCDHPEIEIIFDNHHCSRSKCVVMEHLKVVMYMNSVYKEKLLGCAESFLVQKNNIRIALQRETKIASKLTICIFPKVTLFTCITRNRNKKSIYSRNLFLSKY